MNIRVTRKKLSITNKSRGLQYVGEVIVKGKKTMANISKRVEQALRPYHFTVIQVYVFGLPKANGRDLFGVLNYDDKWVNTRLF